MVSLDNHLVSKEVEHNHPMEIYPLQLLLMVVEKNAFFRHLVNFPLQLQFLLLLHEVDLCLPDLTVQGSVVLEDANEPYY